MQCPKCGAAISDGVILAKASAFVPPGGVYRPVTGYPIVYVIANGSPRGPIVGDAPPDQYYEALSHSIGD